MVVLTRRQVETLVQQRRQAMAETRFKPENFSEIQRVLGLRFAPNLPLVVSKQRANAANAYLKRLQRDVQRSQVGYYSHLHALPLQIRRMTIHKEDQRSFKSVLVPKLKLPTLLENSTSSPRTLPSVSPKIVSPKLDLPYNVSPKMESPKNVAVKSVSPGSVSPSGSGAAVVEEGSSYVAHKSFSPYTNTHVHVLYKQGPGSVTPRKASVASTASGANSVIGKSPRSNHFPLVMGKLPPEDPAARSVDDTESSVSTWTVETPPQPYSFLNMSPSQAPVHHAKKQLFVNLMPRPDRPAKESKESPMQAAAVAADQSIKPHVTLPAIHHTVSKKTKNGIPSRVAEDLLAGGNPTAALYKFVLPSRQLASVSTEPVERPKQSVMGSRLRLHLPSISNKTGMGSQLMAVSSVSRANAIQAAA